MRPIGLLMRRHARHVVARARSYRCTLPPPRDIRGLLAGVTHTEMGLSFSQALELLSDVGEDELAEWEQEWRHSSSAAGGRQELRYCTPAVSVIDTLFSDKSDGRALRSLHFNDRLDIAQVGTPHVHLQLPFHA